jgi:NADH-quinone oxidoreductase subunit N
MISKPSAPKANISSLIAHDKKQTLATFRTLGSYLEKQFWMFRKTREGVLLTAALVCQLFLVFSYTLGFLRVGFLLVILAFLILSSVNSSRPLLGCYIPKQIFITVCLFASLLMLTQISLFEVVELSRWDAFAEFYHQDYIIVDFYTAMLQLYLFGGIAVFLFVTFEYLVKYSTRKGINLAEFPVVICFASFFMLFLISSFNFFGAYVSLEGVTFSLYILAGMNYNSQNALESGMKYFCLGALSSGILLFGIALIFIITKTLDFSELKFLFDSIRDLPLLLSFSLMFMFFGFWFKLSIFPCHVWTPDVYEGVLTPVTLFFSTVVKFGVFTFFVRVLFFLLGSQTFLFF